MRLAIPIISFAALLFMEPALSKPTTSNEGKGSFVVYDNTFYKDKPDTQRDGLVASNILYEGEIWLHDENYGRLPNRKAFQELVREHSTKPGPLVLDIERLPVKGSAEAVRGNLITLATLADWAREAVPGKVVGFYGTNTLSKVAPQSTAYARELARHVDALFPPMYTFNDDRSDWSSRAEASAAEAHELAPGKPVYFYLWPQYHDGTPRAFQYIDSAYWKFEMETSYLYADGIVVWSPSRYTWDDSTGWWRATRDFIHSIRQPRLGTTN